MTHTIYQRWRRLKLTGEWKRRALSFAQSPSEDGKTSFYFGRDRELSGSPPGLEVAVPSCHLPTI